MNLYGKTWSRREIEARTGRLEQIGGVRRMMLIEGPEAGVEQVQVRTGGGLAYYVSPQRGLDISLAEFQGVPLSWQSPNGDVHPAYFDSHGTGFLRSAAGGLLMTCGLTQVGSPCEDNGESLGLHGRYHHTPARQVAAQGRWLKSADEETAEIGEAETDCYEIQVCGIVEETTIFGQILCLTRQITSRLGENRLSIRDVVENLGFEPAPHMLLYHFNFGFPLMAEQTRLTFPSRQARPREADAPSSGMETWEAPQASYRERVYYHEDLTSNPRKVSNGIQDWTTVSIQNPEFPLANGRNAYPLTVRLSWDKRNLPYFVEWKMPGEGVHVLGIEPSNCHVEGRYREREMGTLQMLAPGERRVYHLEIAIDS